MTNEDFIRRLKATIETDPEVSYVEEVDEYYDLKVHMKDGSSFDIRVE